MVELFNRRTKIKDMDKEIKNFLIERIKDADRKGVINWLEFRNYCIEYGITDPPNILTIPVPVLDFLLGEAIKETTFTDNLNRPDVMVINNERRN